MLVVHACAYSSSAVMRAFEHRAAAFAVVLGTRQRASLQSHITRQQELSVQYEAHFCQVVDLVLCPLNFDFVGVMLVLCTLIL